MRGDFLSVVLGCLVSGAMLVAPCGAADVRAVAREKAEAIRIISAKAERFAATLAQGRLFSAYLSASTQSEGERMRTRLGESFKALESRYGMSSFTVVDLDGAVFVHVGRAEPAPTKSPRKNPVLTKGLTLQERQVARVMNDDSITYVSPVVRQGDTRFVLSIDQDMSAYDRVLALGLSRPFYVLVVDAAGTILSDSRTSTPDTKAGIAGGLTLAQLRHDLGAGATEGTGLVTRDGAQFNISYQTVGEWTVIAVEALPPSTTCLRTGEKECR